MSEISGIHSGDIAEGGITRSGPFSLPGTYSFVLKMETSNGLYRIDVAIPAHDVPEQGWPSIVLLDSSGCFATCVEALRRMSRRPDATGVGPSVVIGISSSEGDYDVPRRQRDFTPGRAEGHGGRAEGHGTGDAEAFFEFIEKQVKPLVAKEVALDPDRQTLFGHSLAGYFALWVLGTHPQAYRNYAAISPSIWWDRDGLMQSMSALQLRDRRVLLCLGEWEDSLPPWQQAAPGSEQVMVRRRERRMLGNASALADLLQSMLGEERACFALLAEEEHASIVSAAIPRMLRMASLA